MQFFLDDWIVLVMVVVHCLKNRFFFWLEISTCMFQDGLSIVGRGYSSSAVSVISNS